MEWLKKHRVFAKRFTECELFLIWKESFNGWPSLLGEKPAGFDDFPDHRPEKRRVKRGARYKDDYTKPIRCMIFDMLGFEKMEELKYLHRTEKERMLCDLKDTSHGTQIEILQELAEHLAKQLDLQ